jgi:hypothetical protein
MAPGVDVVHRQYPEGQEMDSLAIHVADDKYTPRNHGSGASGTGGGFW